MITITLEKIKSHNPCESGWEKLLASKGSNADMSVEFPVTDILDSNDLDDTLWALRCLPEHSNLWRKYAVWCARQVQHLMTDRRSIDALDVAWRHSEGLATDAELESARDAAADASWDATRAAAEAAWEAAWDAAWSAAWAAAGAAARDATRAAAAYVADAADAAREAQKQKLMQILTNGCWIDDSAGKETGNAL
jgi:hypothetical protein